MQSNNDFHTPQPTGIPALDQRMASMASALNLPTDRTARKEQLAEDLYVVAQTGRLPDDPARSSELLSLIKSIQPLSQIFQTFNG